MDFNLLLDLLERATATQLGQVLFATAALTAVALFIACRMEPKLRLRVASNTPCQDRKDDREWLEHC